MTLCHFNARTEFEKSENTVTFSGCGDIMRVFKPVLALFLLGSLISAPAFAQEKDIDESGKDRLNVGDLPHYDVPEDLYTPEGDSFAALRLFTLEQWTRIRLTNHPLYHYVLSAAKFRAYSSYCKRHELNVNMKPINRLATMNLIEIITSQYEEPEWAKFVGMTDDQTRAWLSDMAHDVYAFEFAAALSTQNEDRESKEASTQQYCLLVEKQSSADYIGLAATARRQLPENKRN